MLSVVVPILIGQRNGTSVKGPSFTRQNGKLTKGHCATKKNVEKMSFQLIPYYFWFYNLTAILVQKASAITFHWAPTTNIFTAVIFVHEKIS
jgi:hypothetical protein